MVQGLFAGSLGFVVVRALQAFVAKSLPRLQRKVWEGLIGCVRVLCRLYKVLNRLQGLYQAVLLDYIGFRDVCGFDADLESYVIVPRAKVPAASALNDAQGVDHCRLRFLRRPIMV